MADPAQTPELALRYLDELSTDIRAAVILDASGEIAACSETDAERARRMAELVRELFERAGAASPDGVSQVEVATPDGEVFAVRHAGWTIAAVTGRFALPSLMFYDLRTVLADLEREAAA
jgi:hypothetical protein